MIIYSCPECGGAILYEIEVCGITKSTLFFSTAWQTGPKIKAGRPEDIELAERRWECPKCSHVVPANTYDELWRWVMDHQLPNGPKRKCVAIDVDAFTTVHQVLGIEISK